MRTSLGYFSMISLRVGPTLEQKGHWKSLNSTIVTLASFGPSIGVQAASSTFCGTDGGGACGAAGFCLMAATISSTFLPCFTIATAWLIQVGARGQAGS